MSKSQFPAAEWWARRRRIDRIREILNTFPEMTEEDGEVLAGCLATLTQGQTLTSDQEAMYRRWWEWLSNVKTGPDAKPASRPSSSRSKPPWRCLPYPSNFEVK